MSEHSNQYTDKQIDTLLDLYFRAGSRPAPWPMIADAMEVPRPSLLPGTTNPLERLLWGIVTGYTGSKPNCKRRVYKPTTARTDRTGWVYQQRENEAIRAALNGQGRLREPPCDEDYIAAVLARSIAEIKARWEEMNPVGFGFTKYVES